MAFHTYLRQRKFDVFNLRSYFCCFLVHLQRFILWRRSVALRHADILSDLDDGEGDSDPGGARDDPRRLVHILLILLVLRLLDGQRGGSWGH